MSIFSFLLAVSRLVYWPGNFFALRFNDATYVEMPKIYGRLKILQRSGKGTIKIGNGAVFRCKDIYNLIGGPYGCSIMLRNGGRLVIGNNVGISNTAIVSENSVIIEDDVIIGGGTKIWDTDFHPIEYDQRKIEGKGNIGANAPILIKQGAFVGGGCTVLKGVTIGKCSVIGAGSVVTKDIPDYEIWAGNPARHIGSLK